jgi:hypothetical protein
MLNAWVEAGDSGPVIMLAGEADVTGRGKLDTLITGQLSDGVRQLTIDISVTIRRSTRPAQQLETSAQREPPCEPAPGWTRETRDEHGTE